MELRRPTVSLVIPMYNEGDHLEDSLRVIAECVSEATWNYEIILVDDGSSDDTWVRLNRLAERLRGLHIIRLSRNFGKELALCAGLDEAKGRAVIVMDGDLQHPPELIPEMVRLWRDERYEIVECVKESRGKEPLFKKMGASLFYGTLNGLTGFELKNASDFKLLDAKVVDAWRQMPERNTFFRGMTAWTGYRRTQIPFQVKPRQSGASRWGFRRLTRLAVEAIVSFSTIPLRLVSLLGVLFFAGAVILGIHTLWMKLLGNAVTGFTTVILLLLMIGSAIMIALGIVGEYIAAIYHEVKNRPRYLVAEQRLSEHTTAAPEDGTHDNQVAVASSGR